jgi:hypothetical protein
MIDEIRARHKPIKTFPESTFVMCEWCSTWDEYFEWPCDAARLLEYIDSLPALEDVVKTIDPFERFGPGEVRMKSDREIAQAILDLFARAGA